MCDPTSRRKATRLDSIDYLCSPACSSSFQLTVEKQTSREVIEGILECLTCKRHFEIRDGLPNLIFPKVLDESNSYTQRRQDRRAETYDRETRVWLRWLGVWEFALWESRARRQLINRLELKKNDSVLETGVGNGSNLPLIANHIGKQGHLDGMDISSGMLNATRQKMKLKDIQVELIQANASYLPYRSGEFDAVLHVGALNQFGDKKRAIEEMYRVTRPGSKIVICDEGLGPGREKTCLGRRILKREPVLFSHKPPVELVPNGIEDLKVYWVWQRTFWVIEFRKKLGD